jgi:hypothetical protein
MQKLAINFFIINKNNYKRAYLTGFFGSYLVGGGVDVVDRVDKLDRDDREKK